MKLFFNTTNNREGRFRKEKKIGVGDSILTYYNPYLHVNLCKIYLCSRNKINKKVDCCLYMLIKITCMQFPYHKVTLDGVYISFSLSLFIFSKLYLFSRLRYKHSKSMIYTQDKYKNSNSSALIPKRLFILNTTNFFYIRTVINYLIKSLINLKEFYCSRLLVFFSSEGLLLSHPEFNYRS